MNDVVVVRADHHDISADIRAAYVLTSWRSSPGCSSGFCGLKLKVNRDFWMHSSICAGRTFHRRITCSLLR